MSLKDRIIANKPREKAGATSSSRFDYQKDWGICQLIDHHKAGADYLIVFDYHEDLLIMDSEYNPSKVSFYQIKGKKSGNWTTSNLIKSENDKAGNPLLSIIGKLYDCKLKHDIETASLNFVSNQRFNVSLHDKSTSLAKDIICIVELSAAERDLITKKIVAEHKLTAAPLYEDITFLKVLDLSLEDSKVHTQGKITDFFESQYPGKKLNAPTIYKMLFDEVKRRSNYNKDIITFEELLSKKAIGRNEFERILNATGIIVDYNEIWRSAEATLQLEGMKFQNLQELRKAWTRMEVEKMNPANDFLIKISQHVKSIIAEQNITGSMSNLSLLESINYVSNIFLTTNKISIGYPKDFINAIILFELYEQ